MDKALNPQEWLRQAKVELDVANHLNSEFHPKPLGIICFHAQQTTEKSIKAVLLKQLAAAGSIQKTHDLSQLLDSIDRARFPFEEDFYDYADELFPYSVITRYPSQVQDGIDEYRTNRAVAKAAEIWEWASRLLVCE